MTQPYPYPLNYGMNPQPRKFSRGIMVWLFVTALAVALVFLLKQNAVPRQGISLSEFHSQLLAGNISEVNLDGDVITGEIKGQAGRTTAFQTQLPTGTVPNWGFTQWLLEHAGDANVTVNNSSSLVMNIVLPLVPWLIIFGVIWFFLFRKLKNQRTLQPQVPTGAPFAAWVYPYQPGTPQAAPTGADANPARPV